MSLLVSPEVFLVGCTQPDYAGLTAYLKASGNEDFNADVNEAVRDGVSGGEVLCSTAAKICYASLTLGKNSNVRRIRAIRDNLKAVYNTGHGSVLEHCQLNFIVRNLSRVATHELVRHRAGFAFSQTSGRYCRLEDIDLVWDPILDPVKDLFLDHMRTTADTVYQAECALGLRKPPPAFPSALPCDCLSLRYAQYGDPERPEPADVRWVPDDTFDFERRKKLTSAIRRIAPNGQANEIFFSANLRALRHVVQLRTSRHAEQEIRNIFDQVYRLVKAKFPTVFEGAKEAEYDGFLEISGLRQQPYDTLATTSKE